MYLRLDLLAIFLHRRIKTKAKKKTAIPPITAGNTSSSIRREAVKDLDSIRLLDGFIAVGIKGYRLTAHMGYPQITTQNVTDMESRAEIKLWKFRGVSGHSWGPREDGVELVGLTLILFGFLGAPSQGFKPVDNTLDTMWGVVESFGRRGPGQTLLKNAPDIGSWAKTRL